MPVIDTRDAFIGICLLAAGTMFLLAYYAEGESNVLKAFMWLCEKGSFPASRKMAFFYAGLCGLLGAIALLTALGFMGGSRQG